jgi:hypothetical protein
MTQHMDGSKVLVGQRMAKSLDILSAVCKKAGYDVFKISVNLHRDVIGRFWMWRLQGQAARFWCARRISSRVVFFTGLVMWVVQPA